MYNFNIELQVKVGSQTINETVVLQGENTSDRDAAIEQAIEDLKNLIEVKLSAVSTTIVDK